MKLWELQVMENGKYIPITLVGKKHTQNLFFTRQEAEVGKKEHADAFPFALRMRISEIR